MSNQPNEETYKGYTLKFSAGVMDVWCSIYYQGARVADRVGETRELARCAARKAIDKGEVGR